MVRRPLAWPPTTHTHTWLTVSNILALWGAMYILHIVHIVYFLAVQGPMYTRYMRMCAPMYAIHHTHLASFLLQSCTVGLDIIV